MIIDLPATTTSLVNGKLVSLRDSGGAVALGRVLTLVVVTDDDVAEDAIKAANTASREHPCRVIVVVRGSKRGTARLDAQIRIGGDAGASEVVVLRLYGALADHGDSVVVPLLLPDAPIVAWWPGAGPPAPSHDPIGRMAQRRITDVSAVRSPGKVLHDRAGHHVAGDSDLSWTRLTYWRTLLASALDQPPHEVVRSAVVAGAGDSPSTDLLAGWLALQLKCPVSRARTRSGGGLSSVRLERTSSTIELVRTDGKVATLSQPGQPDRRIALPRRAVAECLAEELRRLDPDEVYGDVLTRGLAMLTSSQTTTASAAAKAGEISSEGEVKQRAAKADRGARSMAKKIVAATPEPRPTT